MLLGSSASKEGLIQETHKIRLSTPRLENSAVHTVTFNIAAVVEREVMWWWVTRICHKGVRETAIN